jgi:twitching motility protein PilT
MLNHINQNLHRHIVTIENPIEFLHRDVKCSVTQREIGVDTSTFAQGLQASLRQDPDVIVIGEIADSETLDTAIKAAERGHLVISALHAPDVGHALSRLHSMFPTSERDIGRIRLADVLTGLVAQRLMPRKDEKGRVVALEVLVGTADVQGLLREPDNLSTLQSAMARGSSEGMQTFEQAGRSLLDDDLITTEAAAALGVNRKGSR